MGRMFFVLDDDVGMTNALERVLSEFGSVVIAHTVAEGEARLREKRDWAGLIVDVCLPDGSGLDVVATARDLGIWATTVILTAFHDDPKVINRAAELDAHYVVKAEGHPKAWLRYFSAARVNAIDEHAARAWAARHGLCRAELALLIECEDGPSRDVLASRLGISPTTVAKHIQHILEKTRDDTLFAVVMRFVRETRG